MSLNSNTPKEPKEAGCQQEPCSLSSGTPRCDVLERTTLNPADWMALARTLENEAEFYKSALLLVPVVDVKELRNRLYELPELVLANEKKNPAWSKSDLWGIERDIIPSVRALCWSAAALLPESDELRDRHERATSNANQPS